MFNENRFFGQSVLEESEILPAPKLVTRGHVEEHTMFSVIKVIMGDKWRQGIEPIFWSTCDCLDTGYQEVITVPALTSWQPRAIQQCENS